MHALFDDPLINNSQNANTLANNGEKPILTQLFARVKRVARGEVINIFLLNVLCNNISIKMYRNLSLCNTLSLRHFVLFLWT